MPLTVYYTAGSPPCIQVFLAAKALHLDLELIHLDLMNNEHKLKPEFVKLNPQKIVPTLVDGDFVLWESRAISRYLVNKYGAGTKLYPQDPQSRAVIDRLLDFDLSVLYPSFFDYYYPQYFVEGAVAEEGKKKELEEALSLVNTFLEGKKYIAGADLTLADLGIVTSVLTIDYYGISLKAYPNIVRWFELVKSTTPGYKESSVDILDRFQPVMDELRKQKGF